MTALALALVIPWAAGIVLVLLDGRRRARRLARGRRAGGQPRRARRARRRGPLATGPVEATTGDWPAGVGITLRADALGVLFAAALVAGAARRDGPRGRSTACASASSPGWSCCSRAGLTGVFLTGDLFNFYVFFELSMTAAYILATYGGTRRELGAALVFTTVNLLGTFVFLLSVAGLYHVTGTLDMAQIAERMADVDPNAAILIAVGFFVAFSVKLGLFPFHFWLPTVYTGARPAVAAILSGGLANIGAYGLLRFGAELLPGELALASTRADRDRLRLDHLRRRARGLAAHVERDARLLRDRPGRLRARGDRRRRPGRASPPRSSTRSSTRSTRRCCS